MFETEKKALLLERAAVIQVVSALRRYRDASTLLLAKRYSDGECDGVALAIFAETIKDIEVDHA